MWKWIPAGVVVCVFAAGPSLGCASDNATPDAEDAKQTRLVDRLCIVQMHKAAMECRKERRLARQELNEECCKIAQKWAEEMARRGRMEHGGGEQVIARGYKTPLACIAAWMRSSPHRAWILCHRPKAGWGCATSKSGTRYWAGCFKK